MVANCLLDLVDVCDNWQLMVFNRKSPRGKRLGREKVIEEERKNIE